MFNAEEIIELEKKWFMYKLKQKSKIYIFLSVLIFSFSFISYKFYFVKDKIQTNQIVKKEVKQKKQSAKKPDIIIVKKDVIPKEINNTIVEKKSLDINKTVVIKNNKQKNIQITKIDTTKPYHFKLEPTAQGSGLFSSNGFLTLNLPFEEVQKETVKELQEEIIQPIRKIQENSSKNIVNKKPKISIDMKEMDTIAYLKDKYYSTSSIVFALMLAEEYYYEKDYNNSLKWALTANDIDTQNTKSWYWFAKAKVKLNKKEDALRALRAYLSNNSSKRLSTLLHKIELGDTDD